MTEPPRPALCIWPLTGLPEVTPGSPLTDLVGDAVVRCCGELQAHDVIVVTSKVVSKAEGRLVDLPEGDEAAKVALVEREAVRVLRRRADLRITETVHGFVCANAGLDQSNTAPGKAVLLPRDPDRSARKMRDRLAARFGLDTLGVVVSDTFGRPWRTGQTDVAIGAAGFSPVSDYRGVHDRAGREMHVTEVARADELAAAADLVKGKVDGVPAALVRGLRLEGDGCARDLIRPASEDLFR